MKFSPLECVEILDALKELRQKPFSEPLIQVKIENVEMVKQLFSMFGFQICKTGHGRIIRVRNFKTGENDYPEHDFHIFYGE